MKQETKNNVDLIYACTLMCSPNL